MGRNDARLCLAAAVLLALLAPEAALAEAGRITGLAGSVSGAADRELAEHGAVGESEKIETGEDGNVAMLVGDDVLVELCPQSALVIEPEAGGKRIVRVESGDARIVVEPGQNVPIEIHTPAAIATILGTVVYVTVDPETGQTTITSSDHDVEVQRIGSNAAPIQISGGERTTVAWGGDPTRPRKLGFTSMRNLGSCLGDFDRRLRTEAVIRARREQQTSMVAETAVADMLAAEALPPVGASPIAQSLLDGSGSGPGQGPSPIEDLELPYDPSDTVEPRAIAPARALAPCPGPPCEQGTF
jgi:hypothetical protein